jgi:hypothetical protein
MTEQQTTETVFAVAPLDPYAERITSGIALLGGVLTLPALFWFLSGIGPVVGVISGVVVSSAIALAMVIWLMLNYAVQPTSYRIEAGKLVIKRRWVRALSLPFAQIAGVSVAGALADVPRRGLRRSFNAGVFGYHGPFQLAPYGRVFFAATNREKLIAVARVDTPPLILSPDRPRPFVEALREALLLQAQSFGEQRKVAEDQIGHRH